MVHGPLPGAKRERRLKSWDQDRLSGSGSGLCQAAGRTREEEGVPMKEEHPKTGSNTEFIALLRITLPHF